MLKLTDIHGHYGSIHALKGLNINIETGKVVTLLGANGAGKTTTLKCISGLMTPSKGQILFENDDLTKKASRKLYS